MENKCSSTENWVNFSSDVLYYYIHSLAILKTSFFLLFFEPTTKLSLQFEKAPAGKEEEEEERFGL